MAVTQVDVGGSLLKGHEIGNALTQLRAQKDQLESRNRLRDLYAGGLPTNPQGQQQFVGDVIAETGDPGLAMDWQGHFDAQDERRRATLKAEAPFFVSAFENANDEQSYQMGRSWLQARGIDVSDVPENYDPRAVNMAVQGYRYLGGIEEPKGAAPSNIAKLMAERDALPANDPRRATYDAAIQKASTNAPPAQTNVTVGGGKYGTIPPGYQLIEGPDGARMVPIPGGPAATEQAATEAAAASEATTQKRYADVVMDNITNVRKLVEGSKIPVTGFGSYLAAIPGTPARDTQARVDTIRANIGFDRLQQMREASPTGGALGQVSEKENALLQATLGNLELSQSEAQFLANLKAVEETYLDIIHGPGNRPSASEIAEKPKRMKYNPETGELEPVS